MIAYSAIRFVKQIIQPYLPLRRLFCDNASETNKKYLLIEKLGNFTTIGINRPSKRNCLNAETITQLKQAFEDFENDDSSRVAVLHGEGGSFCSGYDLDEIIEHGYEPILDAISNFKTQPFCNKPVVAGVSGYAVAEGFELALGCDLRVIEDTAVMGFLGRRFGAPLLMDGSRLLSNLVGGSRAFDVSMTGRMLNGHTANDWGLATRIVATGTALGQAISAASCVAKFPENGLQYDRMKIWESFRQENGKLAQHRKEEFDRLRKLAVEDVKKLALRFKEGIGRHGKFHSLKKREVLSWEREDDEIREKTKNESQKIKITQNFDDELR